MSSIYLLRHCDYENPRSILPGRLPLTLSPKGEAQAQKLAEHFADKNIARIYSSQVERCKQTSEIIAGNSGVKIPITFDQRILETLSAYQGFWDENWHGEGYHFFSHKPELGGEGLADIQKRMASFWNELIEEMRERNSQENVIICSHGDPLMVLYLHIFNLPLVDDNVKEDADLAGWLEKGEFFEVTLEDGKVVQVSEAQKL